MNPGTLDREIAIQARQSSPDSFGQPVETWTDYLTAVPCRVMPVRGNESQAAEQRVYQSEKVFRCRWLQLDPAIHRVIYEGDIYDIVDLIENGRRHTLDIKGRYRSTR